MAKAFVPFTRDDQRTPDGRDTRPARKSKRAGKPRGFAPAGRALVRPASGLRGK